jgi:hypothetical protein
MQHQAIVIECALFAAIHGTDPLLTPCRTGAEEESHHAPSPPDPHPPPPTLLQTVQATLRPVIDLDVPSEPPPEANGPVTLRGLLGSQTGVKFFKEFLRARYCPRR